MIEFQQENCLLQNFDYALVFHPYRSSLSELLKAKKTSRLKEGTL